MKKTKEKVENIYSKQQLDKQQKIRRFFKVNPQFQKNPQFSNDLSVISEESMLSNNNTMLNFTQTRISVNTGQKKWRQTANYNDQSQISRMTSEFAIEEVNEEDEVTGQDRPDRSKLKSNKSLFNKFQKNPQDPKSDSSSNTSDDEILINMPQGIEVGYSKEENVQAGIIQSSPPNNIDDDEMEKCLKKMKTMGNLSKT